MTTEEKIVAQIDNLIKLQSIESEIRDLKDSMKMTLGYDMYECQKEFIYNIRISDKGCAVKKCRRAGITTAYAMHVAYKVKAEGNAMGQILVVAPNKELLKEFDKYTKAFLNTKSECQTYEAKVTRTEPTRLPSKICSQRYDEVFFDEAAFYNNLCDASAALGATGTKIIIASTPNSSSENNDFDKMLIHALKDEIPYQIINWYEIPNFNKHLVWVKILKEETVDKEGNIVQDKDHWNKMIADGWEPHSPWFDGISPKLGSKSKDELLGDQE